MEGFEGVLFDVDGVLVDSPHERAWRETLEALMATEWREIAPETRYAPERFTTAVYQELVAGKPRESGARAVLDHFGVPDAAARARVYAERKQEAISRLIEAGEVAAFPDAVRLLIRVKAAGLAVAAASSSRNANALLSRILVEPFVKGERLPFVHAGTRLIDLFDRNISGADLPRGKPHPDIFLEAARALGIAPARSLVIEDAPAGVQAAKAGGMAALGVARLGDAALLEAAGADRVVTSLDEVRAEDLGAGRLAAA